MKIFVKSLLLSFLVFSTSCAIIGNKNVVEVGIDSNPQGADILIEGRNYGRTPAVLEIEPKNYMVVLTKEGHGTAQFEMQAWGTVRTDIDGNRTSDGTRCFLDTMSVIFFFDSFTKYCQDFKEKKYNVQIPYLGSSAAIKGRPEGGFKANEITPEIVNHYYQQDLTNYGKGAQKPRQQ